MIAAALLERRLALDRGEGSPHAEGERGLLQLAFPVLVASKPMFPCCHLQVASHT